MEQTKASSLIDMANGAIKERLDYEMGRVIQNISDPNTKATAKRTITVKITLEPDEERQHVEVSATASRPWQPCTRSRPPWQSARRAATP